MVSWSIAVAFPLLSFVLVVGANDNPLKFALAHAIQRVRIMMLSHQSAYVRVSSSARLWQCKHSLASLTCLYESLNTPARSSDEAQLAPHLRV